MVELYPRLPRMFNKRTATRALMLLRAAQITPHGYPRKYHNKYRTYRWHEECVVLERLTSLGLICSGPWGPRAGLTYKPTELGELVLDVIAQHGPSYKSALALLPQFEGRMM